MYTHAKEQYYYIIFSMHSLITSDWSVYIPFYSTNGYLWKFKTDVLYVANSLII